MCEETWFGGLLKILVIHTESLKIEKKKLQVFE